MKYMGIDPGKKGGIAVIDTETTEVEAYNMPEFYTDIYDLLRDLSFRHGVHKLTVIIEDVGQGIPAQSSKATATFARHNGWLEMALYALALRTEKVKPQKWQKKFSNQVSRPKGMPEAEWKNMLKSLAQRLYPQVKVTLPKADALLLAEYGKREKI